MAATKKHPSQKLSPADVSKLSVVAYLMRGNTADRAAVDKVQFSAPFAEEVAVALKGGKTKDASAQRAAAALGNWTRKK